jgi:hypothetical protein
MIAADPRELAKFPWGVLMLLALFLGASYLAGEFGVDYTLTASIEGRAGAPAGWLPWVPLRIGTGLVIR